MMLDVFNGDGFHVTNLVAAINSLPFTPTRIRDMGLFAESGMDSVTAAVEIEGDTLSLVSTAPRGAPAAVTNLGRREMKNISAVHLPQRVQLYADEVLNLRAFGKETEAEIGMNRLKKKMAKARRDLELTMEFHRINALKGRVLDADNTRVLWNYFTFFGLTQETIDYDMDDTTADMFLQNMALIRRMDDSLGGLSRTGIHVFCSQQFFDGLTGHTSTKESYKAQEAAVLRGDLRKGFRIGEVTYEEYRGQVGSVKFVEDNLAYAFPTGVPELFTTRYAPANTMAAVGNEGVPFYASLEPLPHGTGIDCLTQSNPLHFVERPKSLIKLGKNAAALA